MSSVNIDVVCCDLTQDKHSRVVEVTIDEAELERRTLESVEQELPAGESRGLHNATHHPEHGVVTYLQQVHSGGFAVRFGAPDDLQERFYDAGTWVAFIDDEGPGHASKVGQDGVSRTFRILRGHLDVQ